MTVSPLDRPKTKARIIAFAMEGMSCRAIAAAISTPQKTVSFQRVAMFLKRHQDEIAPAKQEVVKQATDYAIASKVERIQALNNRWALGHQVILARAEDKTFAWAPGYSTGLLVRDVKAVGSGEGADLVDVFKVDTSLLAELRALERSAAEELGQIEKAQVTVNTAPTYILQVIGASEDIPLG